MRSIRFLLVIIACMSGANAWAAKPLPPLSVTIHADALPQPMTTWPLQVTVKSTQALAQTKVTLSLPANASLVQGQAEQSLELKQGQPVTLQYILYLPKELVGAVQVKAETGDAQSVYFSSQDEIVFNSSNTARKGMARSREAASRNVERGRETIHEYPLTP